MNNLDKIPILKKGGIHIKKKNRGKFTEYCGGKVTEECIARGKRSKNPLTRKRANFASVSRKWKHENGGIVNRFQPGGTVSKTSSQQSAETEAKSFLRSWYSHPTTQQMMGELDYNDYERYPVVTPTGMEIKDPELARKVKAISALRTPVNYVELPENKLGQHGTTGMDPNKNFININKDLFGKALSSTLVHEGDHAVQTQMPFINRTTQPVKHKLKPEYDVDSYIDKPNEIRSRIMETRKFFNLDPAKRDYTPNEAAEMQKQLMEAGQSAGSASQLNRLTPETMAGYLNYLASNDTKKSSNNIGRPMYEEDVNYAAKGGILKVQEGTGNNFWSKLWNAVKEGGMAARDAKIGAIGAQQVRDLYSVGKNQEAQDLAKQYAKANTTGIALAGGAASTGLLGDLMVTGATTAADTFIDGDVDNFGKNLVKNGAGDLIGHGVFKGLKYFNGKPIFVKEMKNGIGDGLYHLDYGDAKGAFKSGAYVKNGYLYPGKTDLNEQLDYIWFNESKPYATAVRGKPFSRTIIFEQKDVPGILRVREQNYPIGQWNGKSGFVTKHEMVTSNPIDMDNATVYKRIPILNTWLRTK